MVVWGFTRICVKSCRSSAIDVLSTRLVQGWTCVVLLRPERIPRGGATKQAVCLAALAEVAKRAKSFLRGWQVDAIEEERRERLLAVVSNRNDHRLVVTVIIAAATAAEQIVGAVPRRGELRDHRGVWEVFAEIAEGCVGAWGESVRVLIGSGSNCCGNRAADD